MVAAQAGVDLLECINSSSTRRASACAQEATTTFSPPGGDARERGALHAGARATGGIQASGLRRSWPRGPRGAAAPGSGRLPREPARVSVDPGPKVRHCSTITRLERQADTLSPLVRVPFYDDTITRIKADALLYDEDSFSWFQAEDILSVNQDAARAFYKSVANLLVQEKEADYDLSTVNSAPRSHAPLLSSTLPPCRWRRTRC